MFVICFIVYSMSYIDEYNSLISQYREKTSEVRRAERKEEDRTVIFFLDKERDEIHNKLRELGKLIGKTSQDILLDILVSEKKLEEYHLPEFKVLRTINAMDAFDYIAVSKNNGEEVIYQKKDSLPKDFEFFIPFGEQEAYHLFDWEQFLFSPVDTAERKRRRDILIQYTDRKMVPIEIYSSHSYHNGTQLYGLAFSSEDFDQIVRIMKEHQSEISIDRSYFSEAELRDDFREYIEGVVEYILERPLDECETRAYLVETLQRSLPYALGGDVEYFETVREFLENSYEKAIDLDEKERIQKEISEERREEDRTEYRFPGQVELPSKEPFRGINRKRG